MTVEIRKGKAKGTIIASPSKSMAHRDLICGAFSVDSEITGVHMSKDIEATLGCLKALGARAELCGTTVRIGGLDFGKKEFTDDIFCNESGSTLRFLIPICLLFEREIKLTGSKRLFQRSLDVYKKLCDERYLGFDISDDCVIVKGPLKSGIFEVRGDVSSQFISGLLFALPHCKGNSEIRIVGELESASYIDLTVAALKDFGVVVDRPDKRTFLIAGEQTFKSKKAEVEGDYSNAAFFEALDRVGGDVRIEGLKADSMQGDRVYGKLFDRVEKRDFPIDISDCPDLAPILFAFSAVKGEGEFVGTRRLKIKESDRAEAMRAELAKVGADVKVGENTVSITCQELKAPRENFCGHNDHRIVMAMAVISTLTGGVIEEAEAVSKSFPDFFECFQSLGIEVYKNDAQ